jgi:hypothetical protein
MKLDYWNNKFFTTELNSKHMSDAHKWPQLDSVLEAADRNIPLTSRSAVGKSIYIGWAHIGPDGKPDMWFYHHMLCAPRIEGTGGRRFGFTLNRSEVPWLSIVSSKKKVLSPVFNVGELPESEVFVKILRDHGILARVGMPALSVAELIKK